MRRALEIVFRQQRQFLLLVTLLSALSLVIGFFIPRPYQASASIWAANRYNLTDATWASQWYRILGVDNGVPAQVQAGALTELLNTRAFALQVANATDLPKRMSTASQQQRDDALYADISHNVKVAVAGNNLVLITYTNADAHIALQMVGATVQAFAKASQQLAVQSGQELLTADQAQLAALQNAANQAVADLQAYRAAHPRETPSEQANDPQYQTLSQQVTNANNYVQSLQSQIGQLQLQLATIGWQPDAFFTVQDTPAMIPSPTSRAQTLLLALAVGLAVALAIASLYLAAVMRADHAVYIAADVKSCLSVPVLAEIPAVVIAPPIRALFATVDGSVLRVSDAVGPAPAPLAVQRTAG